MAKDSAHETAKEATARAREMLLADRIPAFENLAAAQAEVSKIDERIARDRAARSEAQQAVRDRYEEALQAGWSASQLRELGYTAPRGKSTQRARRASASNTAADASATTSTGADSKQQSSSEARGHAADATAAQADDSADTRQDRETA